MTIYRANTLRLKHFLVKLSPYSGRYAHSVSTDYDTAIREKSSRIWKKSTYADKKIRVGHDGLGIYWHSNHRFGKHAFNQPLHFCTDYPNNRG